MISLLIPSRGRPEMFKQAVESFRNMAVEDVEVVSVLDVDDPTIEQYDLAPVDVAYWRNPLEEPVFSSSWAWNTMAYLATGDRVMMANDDHRALTYGWDMALSSCGEFDVSWPDAGQAGQCINPVVSQAWIKAVGWYIQPGFRWWYCDTSVQSVGSAAGQLAYMPDVKFEHISDEAGKRAEDDTDRRNNDEAMREQDKLHFRCTFHVRREAAQRIWEAMV